MTRSRSAAALLALSLSGAPVAAAPSNAAPTAPSAKAAAAARRALAVIAKPGNVGGAHQQAVLSLNALAEPGSGLPETWRRSLEAIASPGVGAAVRQQLVAAALDELDAGFVPRLCGDKTAAVVALAPAGMLTKCRTRGGALLPQRAGAMQRTGSILLAAAIAEQLQKRGASPEELTLARYVAHFDPVDANAPAVSQP